MHYEEKQALLQLQLERVREDLWETQLQEFPDSIKMTYADVVDLTYSDPNYLGPTLKAFDEGLGLLYKEGVDRAVAKSELYHRTVTTFQLRLARTLLIALQTPEGIFYRCGKQPDGTYRWMGLRYGVEPSQYMSDFEL